MPTWIIVGTFDFLGLCCAYVEIRIPQVKFEIRVQRLNLDRMLSHVAGMWGRPVRLPDRCEHAGLMLGSFGWI